VNWGFREEDDVMKKLAVEWALIIYMRR